MRGLHVATPLIRSEGLSALLGRPVLLKMDGLQPTGSFKLRGIGAAVAAAAEAGATTIVSSSGGNAGLAAAYAARALGLRATVVLPLSTPGSVAGRLRAYGAEATFHGAVWDEANAKAEAIVAASDGTAALVHPFEGETTWAGHATIVQELVADLPGPPAGVVTVVGGGGLLLGILDGLASQPGWERVPVVACETHGADCLAQALSAGRLVTLEGISSVAKSLGAATVSPSALAAATKPDSSVRSCVVTDTEAVSACLRFADEHRLLVEPACGAGLAAVYRRDPAVLAVCAEAAEEAPLVVEVCGGALVDRAQLEVWAEATGANAEYFSA